MTVLSPRGKKEKGSRRELRKSRLPSGYAAAHGTGSMVARKLALHVRPAGPSIGGKSRIARQSVS